MHRHVLARAGLACIVLALPSALSIVGTRAARARTPQLVVTVPVLCMDDAEGRRVRVQCDDKGQPPGTCLVAPACTGDPCQELERTTYCTEAGDGERWADLVAKGYTFIPARADVIDGFYRDDEGRAFQVSFDLHDRMFFGGSYIHTFAAPSASGASRDRDGVLLELGFDMQDLFDGGRSKNRYRFLELALVPEPLQIRGALLHFDSSNVGDEPFMRVTTFIGEPARHDLFLQGGWWLDLLGLDNRPRGSANDTIVRVAGGGVTWDIWQDADMTSFLRVKLGVGFDDQVDVAAGSGRFVVAPLGALEGDFTFDDEGFHHLVIASRFEAAFVQDTDGKRFDYRRRFESEIAYELILVAIDDQPLTLHVGASGGYRDDLTEGNGWEVTVAAGLRLSLWAPPRDLAARDEALRQRKQHGNVP